MPRKRSIDRLLTKATNDFSDISDIHKKLLKLGYGKNFTIFMQELKARVTYRRIFE